MEDLIGKLSKSSLFTVADKTIEVQRASAQETLQAVELLGTIVDSKYKIVQLLGAGGMGTVYLARHLMLDKDVALKTFKSANLTHEERLRFQREAQAIAKLNNANIIEVFDFGYVNGEVPYYTMERLVGQSLREKLDSCQFLSVTEAVSVFIQVCRGLSAAHKKGIIHRDLKPDNIFLQSFQSLQSLQPLQSVQSKTSGPNALQSNALTVKIVDFGIATLTVAPTETQKLTALGTIFGSPLYMSPEQSMGHPVGKSSDIYSCGCALFQALAGKPPFVGSNALTTLLMHQSSPIPNLKSAMNGRSCPQALEKLVSTMLAKSPEDRYQNVDEVLDFLLHIEKMNELGHEDFQEEHYKDAVENGEKAGAEAEEEEGDKEDDQEENGDHASRTIFTIVALGAALVSTLSIALIAYIYFVSNTRQASLESKTTPIDAEPRPRPAPSQIPEKFPDEKYFPDIQMEKLEKRLAYPTPDMRLVVSQFAKISDPTIERIASTSWIRNLTISRCDFNNQSLGKLTKLNLIRINLEHTKFNDQGAKSLSQCQTLQEIKAQSTDITNDGLKELSSIKGLKILRLSKTIVNADGIRYLCKKNRNCTTIYLADCRNITLADIAKLRQEFHQVNFITDINAH